jgi:2-polyprenyl-3-methyl-5-hydroxy-6-metoxy-1,4-benzoquinol methylase
MSFVGEAKGLASDTADRVLSGLGFKQTESKLKRDSANFWTRASDDNWQNQTHMASGSAFAQMEWEKVGRDHLALFQEMSQGLTTRGTDKIVEWGVGGGSNAVAFAPLAKDFVGIDLTQEIVDEAGRQVAKLDLPTRFEPLVIPVDYSPLMVDNPVGGMDLFLCTYVLELVPSPAYGLDLMATAFRLLYPGGLAFVQIKYDTGAWRTHSRGRRYRASVAASMTTYRIDQFWEQMTAIGFKHAAGVRLVPKNELDERYAYYLLRKPWDTAGDRRSS